MNCPNCQGDARLESSQKLPEQRIIRRSWRCEDCSYQWVNPEPIKTRAGISDDALRDILTSLDSNAVVGRRWLLDRTTISALRLGRIHPNRLPELPRWTKRTCDCCIQWENGRCLLGHADPESEGVRFARWCSTYQAVP